MGYHLRSGKWNSTPATAILFRTVSLTFFFLIFLIQSLYFVFILKTETCAIKDTHDAISWWECRKNNVQDIDTVSVWLSDLIPEFSRVSAQFDLSYIFIRSIYSTDSVHETEHQTKLKSWNQVDLLRYWHDERVDDMVLHACGHTLRGNCLKFSCILYDVN